MSNQSIHGKTIRPGSLNGYSYYYSNHRPVTQAPAKTARKPIKIPLKGLLVVGVLLALIGLPLLRNDATPKKSSASNNTLATAPATSAARDSVNHCTGNTEDKLIKISINQRRLWACEQGNPVRDTSVITGLQGHKETETPLGTYRVYAKQTNTTLKGADSRGSWSDPVYYWMPFLDNKYGTYGFHDATWRPADAFGTVGPDSQDASHGCVELPLAASKWLYNWAPVGTTVKVEA